MVQSPPEKPRIRARSVFGTVIGLIGTGGSFVGGAILMSYHKMTIDDHHERIAAGVSTVVVSGVMIIISLIIGVMDGYDTYRYWKWTKEQNKVPQEVRQASTTRPPTEV